MPGKKQMKSEQMISVGYMLKKVVHRPDWIKAENVLDIYSVSGCVSHTFAKYINFWKHNGYWFFDSPDIIYTISKREHIDLTGTQLFYYEVYEREYDEDEKIWQEFVPEKSFITNVQVPEKKKIEGYDAVTFSVHTSPECSPLSCNSFAEKIPVNQHCLLESFSEAKQLLENGKFDNSEPGPFRIFAVYSLPESSAIND
jgi:hypothetical protein